MSVFNNCDISKANKVMLSFQCHKEVSPDVEVHHQLVAQKG